MTTITTFRNKRPFGWSKATTMYYDGRPKKIVSARFVFYPKWRGVRRRRPSLSAKWSGSSMCVRSTLPTSFRPPTVGTCTWTGLPVPLWWCTARRPRRKSHRPPVGTSNPFAWLSGIQVYDFTIVLSIKN